jgi:hypothetical protein
MRADRLLSLLMLLSRLAVGCRLEAGGRAGGLRADHLPDVEALRRCRRSSLRAGRAGGRPTRCSIATAPTSPGWTEGEVRALSLLSIPRALGALGMGHGAAGGLLKLSAALPEARRHDEASVRQALLHGFDHGGHRARSPSRTCGRSTTPSGRFAGSI